MDTGPSVLIARAQVPLPALTRLQVVSCTRNQLSDRFLTPRLLRTNSYENSTMSDEYMIVATRARSAVLPPHLGSPL